MAVNIIDLDFSYDTRKVLHNINFSAEGGSLVAVLGPNGVGKSTLFRCILGFLRPDKGSVLLNGREISSLSRQEAAREIAYIPQVASPTFDYTVLEMVLMGVSNQLGYFESPGPAHREQALDTLGDLGIAHLRNRGCAQISGGERQLALLARALIQNAKVLLMDEPTANLDYGNQYRVMERIAGLASKGYTVIFSTHDPNQALLHANRVFALKGGTT
ncbi:MAG: ABC transporter ATP-binding protein, partial [Bacillota bacterium]|nr:ABC transporter ATP-binding protein [Bacillota bacterium]